MKTFFSKPGFEFVFSLCLIVILGLPPMLMAQTSKNLDITIVNGDTTVNGRNIKELSPKERHEALKDIYRIDRQKPVIVYDSAMVRVDTTVIMGEPRPKIRRDMGPRFNNDNRFNANMAPDRNGFRGGNFNGGFMPPMRNERKNSQNFDYVTVDNEGISTHVRFHVSEISNEDLKKMPHVEGGKFEISDLNLVPEFSTGKTLLMFTMPGKAAADVKVTDSEGKLLFSEKATGGHFSKTFALGLNGIYYMQVKQGNNIAIKKITKES